MLSQSTSETNISRAWIWLTVSLYGLFTLLGDSHSLMVQWPWVAIWQIALLCPIFWLISSIWHQGKLSTLGNGLDWILGIVGLGIIISTLWAEFPFQARWYGWASLCMIAAIYALNQWLTIPHKYSSARRYYLLILQGYLNLAFIIYSLFLWTTQTLLPELTRLNTLKQFGVNLPFDFSILELRNWAPIGHQNYVAGYLLLTIPLLIGLAILQTGWRRWLWSIGVGLGILDLYTTSSRGGWLGLIGVCIFGLGVLLIKSRLPRLWVGLGGIGTIILLIAFIIANNRLKTVFMAIIQGKGEGEFAYRLINASIGWQMGSQHPLYGIGLGNVPLTYQKYRPFWAGRESELIYQLHSTPVQLWAETGIWGILSLLGVLIFLIYGLIRYSSPEQQTDKILLWSLYGGLFAYGIMSLTDYQLDNMGISGTLVIYFTYLASLFKTQQKNPQGFLILPPAVFFTGLGIILAVIIWLIPIHRAWQLSSQGFLALSQDKVEIFSQYLSKAEKLAPWESYYPYQLGWNKGDLAIQINNPQFLSESIKGFEAGNKASPYQEFGHSNLGWLLLRQNPSAATGEFLESAKLIPAKKGIFYGLGVSLLTQNKLDLAVEAITLECLRDPLFITSPIWRIPSLQSLYTLVTQRMLTHYSTLSQTKPELVNYFHQSRGGLYWWLGDVAKAQTDWNNQGNQLNQQMLALETGKFPQLSSPSANLLLQAWKTPSQRATLVKQAFLQEKQLELPEALEKDFLASMERSGSFPQWLKQNAPVWQYRRQRSGFGVNSRHIDGVQPFDFLPVMENLAMTTWFSELLPSHDYFPELDLALQPLRNNLMAKLQ